MVIKLGPPVEALSIHCYAYKAVAEGQVVEYAVDSNNNVVPTFTYAGDTYVSVQPITSTSNKGIGVAKNGVAAGEIVEVILLGVVTLTASGAIGTGAAVILDTAAGKQGQVADNGAADNDLVVGNALEAAAQAGDKIRVLWKGSRTWGAG